MTDLSKVSLPGAGTPSTPEGVLPGLGAPQPPRQRKVLRWLVVVLVLALVGFGAWQALSTEPASEATATAEAEPAAAVSGDAIPAGVYFAMPADISKGGNAGTAVEFEVKRSASGLTIPYVAAFGMDPTDCGQRAAPAEEGGGITFLDDEPSAQRTKAGGAELGASWDGGIELDVQGGGASQVTGTLVFAFDDMRPGCKGRVVFRAKARPKKAGRPFFDQITLAGS